MEDASAVLSSFNPRQKRMLRLLTDIERAVGGLESQYRATDTTRIAKNIRDRIHRAVVASGTGTGKVNWPYTAGSVRNPGLELRGLGKPVSILKHLHQAHPKPGSAVHRPSSASGLLQQPPP